MTSSLFHQVIRSCPAYKLVPIRNLPLGVRKRLGIPVRKSPYRWVLLGDRGARLPVKTVSAPVAEILSALATPKSPLAIPGAKPDPEYRLFLLKQIFDGVLEVRTRGKFISGPAALLALSRVLPEQDPPDELGRLSDRAIQLAYSSALEDPLELAAWLYEFNRLPLTRRWSDRFSEEGKILEYLGCDPQGVWKGMDRRLRPQSSNKSWYSWDIQGSLEKRLASDRGLSKIYVSPIPDHVPEVLRIIVDRVSAGSLLGFKVAKGRDGLLRPDKIVAYFAAPDGAATFTADLARRTRPLKSHGVPFTCQVGNSAMLSSGFDPPVDEGASPLGRGESWRAWIANRIANAIVIVRKTAPRRPLPLIRVALEASGIDPLRWRPLADHWYEGA
jgi:hypothetical protein